jgi:hypothetical protein
MTSGATENHQDVLPSPSRLRHTNLVQSSATYPNVESPSNEGSGSNRPSPVIQQPQIQSVSVPGTLQQPVSDGWHHGTQSASASQEEGPFYGHARRNPTYSNDFWSDPSSTNSAQTTPTPVQKGRFTVTPDSEAAVQIPAASEFSLSAAAIFVSAATTPAVPTKVEKKGRFVVSSAIPSGISVEPETMPHAVELPPSLPIQVTTVAQPPVEPSGQPPPLRSSWYSTTCTSTYCQQHVRPAHEF